MIRNSPIIVGLLSYLSIHLVATSIAWMHWSNYWAWWHEASNFESVCAALLLSLAALVVEVMAIIVGTCAAALLVAALDRLVFKPEGFE